MNNEKATLQFISREKNPIDLLILKIQLDLQSNATGKLMKD